MLPWSNWLTRRTFTAEIAGSTPVGNTKNNILVKLFLTQEIEFVYWRNWLACLRTRSWWGSSPRTLQKMAEVREKRWPPLSNRKMSPLWKYNVDNVGIEVCSVA